MSPQFLNATLAFSLFSASGISLQQHPGHSAVGSRLAAQSAVGGSIAHVSKTQQYMNTAVTVITCLMSLGMFLANRLAAMSSSCTSFLRTLKTTNNTRMRSTERQQGSATFCSKQRSRAMLPCLT